MNFKPQPYWELQTMYQNLFNYEEGILKKEEGEISRAKESPLGEILLTRKRYEYAPNYLI
jgi:DNA topoisomerase-3